MLINKAAGYIISIEFREFFSLKPEAVFIQPIIGITPATDETRYTLNKAYTGSVTQEGGIPLIIPYQDFTKGFKKAAASFDGIILTGGGDIHSSYFNQELHPKANTIYPYRDEFEIKLCRFALNEGIPLLCICRGMQVLNVALGGGLIQHIEGHSQDVPREQASHKVYIAPETMLYKVYGPELSVNSLHHQAVGEIGNGLKVSAVSEDGVTEALEGTGGSFCMGVQWHPEAVDLGNKIFKLFIESLGR